MNRLILCAGRVRRPGWKTLDADPDVGPDILAHVPPLPADVKQRQWDTIEWIHGVGTFDPWVAEVLLADLREVLAPDGILVLEQPDLREGAVAVLENPNMAWWLFGDPSHRDPNMMNRWAYTPETLSNLLRKIGFSRVTVGPAQYHGRLKRDFRIEAQP